MDSLKSEEESSEHHETKGSLSLHLTWHINQCHDKSAQRKAVPERVRHRRLFLGEDLCDDEQIIEQEDLALMQSLTLFLIDVGNFVQATVANESPMRQCQVQLLSHDRLLNFHDLRDVVRGCLELCLLDALVNAAQQIFVDVCAVVDAAEIFNEILGLHSPISFEIRGVQIRVQHDDCKGQHENLSEENVNTRST